ncbi:hypothetical protein [Hyperthermus butylicus]|uniref:Uncharacterized protein n=1 Tax=Hyperthermus butylicus (strain DSM 5456 / JCM 9403 / PLM1-5) TaxID=415426 RepID=A2BLN2_HYPBU|nr:hypothetical protein [Hyperthermus butylicus]ABM80893.1 hypothetical protein Hbut_1050 [Hyperthermus butylicus DSM 5456]
MLAAFPLRADIVAIKDPSNIQPGIYLFARGLRQAYRLSRLQEEYSMFPDTRVSTLLVDDLAEMEIHGRKAVVVEVKADRVSEQAIGRLLTYEALLRIETWIQYIDKVIAAPKNDALSIKLMEL